MFVASFFVLLLRFVVATDVNCEIFKENSCIIKDYISPLEGPTKIQTNESDTDIQALEIHGTKNFPILEKFFHNFVNLEKLTLSSLDLKNLDENFFSDFAWAKCSFTGNRLESVKEKTFRRFGNTLLVIDLSNNGIARVDKLAFHGLKELKILRMNSNGIKCLDSQVFRSLVALRELCLSNNQISDLSDELFANLKNLKFLFLNSNLIAHISGDLVAKNSQLRMLLLSDNRIKTVSRAAKVHLSKIEKLNFNDNLCVDQFLEFYYEPVNSSLLLEKILYPFCDEESDLQEKDFGELIDGTYIFVFLLIVVTLLIVRIVLACYKNRQRQEVEKTSKYSYEARHALKSAKADGKSLLSNWFDKTRFCSVWLIKTCK